MRRLSIALIILVAAVAGSRSMAAGQAAQSGQPAPPAAAPPPATDIYLLQMSGGLPALKNAKPAPVSVVPGYDNQPMFSPDGSRILFAANHDGKQTDVFVFERGKVTQLTRTAENENSPTFLPDGLGDRGGFSVVRTEPPNQAQRLWRFDAAGANPQLILKEVQPVGYHAWIDADRVALFVLGKPATLQFARVGTGKAEVVAGAISRSLHRVPGTRAISFVHNDPPNEYWIKQADFDSKKIESLVKTVEGSSDRDYAWMPDGKTILMTAGTKIHSWTRGATGWIEVFDAAPYKLGALTRLNVSPKGDAIAIVAAEPKP